MRKGFTIAETIVTIVLLAIVFTAIPTILEKATESDINSMEGEALYNAAALLNRVISLPYNSALDENSTHLIANWTGSGCSDPAYGINGASVRVGTVAFNPKEFRKCSEPIAALDSFANITPQMAINHFDGYEDDSLTDRGYKLKVSVLYFDNGESTDWSRWEKGATAATKNQLLVTVTALYAASDEEIGRLHYVVSNVGGWR
ncbi:hypothetical protein AGMMS50229_14960 [Campylobacterota bacterium]|nr:hypothetical protein AGMMS50229_14960 [Campylobacterota bacterium]